MFFTSQTTSHLTSHQRFLIQTLLFLERFSDLSQALISFFFSLSSFLASFQPLISFLLSLYSNPPIVFHTFQSLLSSANHYSSILSVLKQIL